MADIIIRGASVCRGENPIWERTDIAISGEKIECVGKLDNSSAPIEIDAVGLFVTPGFIDIHGHSDFRILEDAHAGSKIKQGVTTEVTGNCGFSAAPAVGVVKKHLSSLYPHLAISWNSFPEYLASIKKTAFNIAPLIGAGNLRASVLGYENIEASDKDLNKMGDLLSDSLSSGAFGLSFGLAYPTGIYANEKEIKYLASIVKKYEGFCSIHMRSEGDNLLKSIAESIDLALTTGVSVQISHLKSRGASNFHKLDKALVMLKEARSKGADIWCDRYPFTALSADLDSVLPNWVYEGGNEKELERLNDYQTALKIKEELNKKQTAGEISWENIIVAKAVKNIQQVVGKSILEISQESNKSPVDVVLDILCENKLMVEMLSYEMSPDNLNKILLDDFVFTGSDASVITIYNDNIHPRNHYSFPVGISHAIAEKNDWAEFVCKNTGIVAKRIGLINRGVLQEGCFADIAVWDKACLEKLDTDVRKLLYSDAKTGVKHVIINGKQVLINEKQQDVFSGKVLLK